MSTCPAFPGPAQHTQSIDIHEGMTLMDYFAGQAITGILAGRYSACRDECGEMLIDSPGTAARLAYEIAAEMISEKLRGEAE